MDSTAVNRGIKSGLEKRIREGFGDTPAVATQLMNIDGDACHHLHNAVGKFCKVFNLHAENLFNNLHVHFNTFTIQMSHLKNICMILGIKFTKPQRFLLV